MFLRLLWPKMLNFNTAGVEVQLSSWWLSPLICSATMSVITVYIKSAFIVKVYGTSWLPLALIWLLNIVMTRTLGVGYECRKILITQTGEQKNKHRHEKQQCIQSQIHQLDLRRIYCKTRQAQKGQYICLLGQR